MVRHLLHFEIVTREDTSPWLVFLHGAGGNIKTWKYQLEAFSQHYNLLLIDLRDHGQSKNIQPAIDKYTFEHISTDIKAVMDHVGVRKAHFVTLSFGSVLMQDFASRYPESVNKIIFAGGIFKGTWAIRAFVHFAKALNLLLPYEKMYSLFSWILMPRERNQKARRLYQMQARKLTQAEYLKWVGLYDEFFRLLSDFFHQRLQHRSLIVMGGDDFVFLRGATQFDRRQTLTQLAVIPTTGHICNVENPAAFNQLALDFLAAKTSSIEKSASTARYGSNVPVSVSE